MPKPYLGVPVDPGEEPGRGHPVQGQFNGL